MSEKIVGRRPTGPAASSAKPRSMAELTDSGAGMREVGHDATGGHEHPVRDGFDRQGQALAAGPLKTQLEALATRGVGNKVQFSNEDLAQLAGVFAALIRQNPKASRSKRAKLFTKAILRRHKRLGKLLEKVPEQEAEAFFESIADALDGSPVFAQMIENVTEEAGKLNG